jgi:hypothetical protein
VQKQIPKYVLQAQERIQDAPTTLNVERPVEVPQIMTAESIVQVPVAQIQIVEKAIPKVTTEAISRMQEVPQVLIEETLVEVPQVQLAEQIRQVPKEILQPRQKGIPKITTQVVEIVQAVPVPLINEVAIDVPQVQVVEVMKQTAALSQQRLVQTSRQYELQTQAFRTMPEERVTGIYEAAVVGVRETMPQPTVVERVSPIMTQGLIEYGAPMTTGYVEYAAPVQEFIVAETAPMLAYEGMVAPTTFVQQEMIVAPTVFETVVGMPTTEVFVPEVVQLPMTM